jgi:hypothetical protein
MRSMYSHGRQPWKDRARSSAHRTTLSRSRRARSERRIDGSTRSVVPSEMMDGDHLVSLDTLSLGHFSQHN